jgi:hypothetical protein
MGVRAGGASDEVVDGLLVITELGAAVDLVVGGLTGLFPSSTRRPDREATMQQLASGFERLLKLTFIQASLHQLGERPSGGRMARSYGHRLLPLTDDLVELASSVPLYADRPIVKDDLGFIRSDMGLRRLLEILGNFGQRGRYSNLDGLLDSAKIDPDSEPRRQWSDVETELVMARSDWVEIAQSSRLESVVTFEVAGRLQRFARALAFMWTLGALGDHGPRHGGELGPILRARDEQLGIEPPRL